MINAEIRFIENNIFSQFLSGFRINLTISALDCDCSKFSCLAL